MPARILAQAVAPLPRRGVHRGACRRVEEVSKLHEHGRVKSMNVASFGGAPSAPANAAQDHVLRFESLFDAGRALVFPCDAQGHVMLDHLSDKARANYLYARAVVGREYAVPQVRRCEAE
jgi:hypothetical protein